MNSEYWKERKDLIKFFKTDINNPLLTEGAKTDRLEVLCNRFLETLERQRAMEKKVNVDNVKTLIEYYYNTVTYLHPRKPLDRNNKRDMAVVKRIIQDIKETFSLVSDQASINKIKELIDVFKYNCEELGIGYEQARSFSSVFFKGDNGLGWIVQTLISIQIRKDEENLQYNADKETENIEDKMLAEDPNCFCWFNEDGTLKED